MKINVLGFGVMGKQISALMQVLGYEVFVWNRQINEDRKLRYEKELKLLSRRLSVKTISTNVTYTEHINELESCMTIEVLVEDIHVKKKVVSLLPYKTEAIELFTNTSSYSPKEISPFAVGLHFFNPVHTFKFAEISRNPCELGRDGQELIDKIQGLGFEVIQTSENRGYIGNYILFQEISTALKLIDLYGYKSQTIDKVLYNIGRSASLFDIIDLVGTDVVKSITENLKQMDSSIYVSPLLDRAIKSNVLGKKNNTSIRDITDHG